MGTHRGSGARGVSKGPVIALVVVVLIAAVIVGWFQLRDRLSSVAEQTAQTCVEGPATLHVTADPIIAPEIRAAADRYSATRPVVRDRCIGVEVSDRPSAAVQAALAGSWDDALGARPALWIPGFSATLDGVPKGLVDGAAESLAASPVVLSVPAPLRDALAAGQVSWKDLPRLQSESTALAGLGLIGWGGLRMTLPPNEATRCAVHAVVADAVGANPVSDDAARSAAVTKAVSQLAANAPKDPGEPGDAQAPVHASAVVRQQLGGAPHYAPLGAMPVADFPVAVLSGDWVDETTGRAAALFADYLRTQRDALRAAGFETDAAPNALRPSTSGAANRISEVMANPVVGTRTTMLVDVSASMGEQGRLTGTVRALREQIAAAPDGSELGIWSFAKNLDGKAYKVDAPTAPLSAQQRKSVDAALAGLKASATRPDHAYPTLIAAYQNAVANYVAGKTNSIVLLTDGPEDDSAITGQQLLTEIAAATDPSKPVRIDIVVLGAHTPNTLETLTSRTGGSVSRISVDQVGRVVAGLLNG